MNFVKAFLFLALAATLLTVGAVLIAKGSPLLFWVTLGALIFGFGKYGCATH